MMGGDATFDEILSWLGEATDAVCPLCGQQALCRFERMNGRCERCREKLNQAIAEREDADRPPGPRPRRDCPTCEGRGWEFYERDGYQFAKKCGCAAGREGERVLEQLRRVGVPPEYWQCTWATWGGDRPGEAQEFARDPKSARVLYVHGLQGRGKTHCATAVFRDLLVRGFDCQWRDCSQLVESLRRWTARRDDESIDTEILRLYEADIVLLDDLGAQRQTAYAEDVIDGLIRFRHSRQLPMIVTSNRSRAQLVAPQDEGGLGRDPAIPSRLAGLTIHLEGPDRRMRPTGSSTTRQEARP